MVDRYWKSRGVDRAADVVEAIVDDCLGVCLEFGILAWFSSNGWRRYVRALDDSEVI